MNLPTRRIKESADEIHEQHFVNREDSHDSNKAKYHITFLGFVYNNNFQNADRVYLHTLHQSDVT